MSWDSLDGDVDPALATGGGEVRQKADPTADVDEITVIKKIDQMEIDLVDSLLRRIDESPEGTIDRQNLLELRNLCQLRHRLLNNLRSEYVAHGAA
jgi:hypothetical protein